MDLIDFDALPESFATTDRPRVQVSETETPAVIQEVKITPVAPSTGASHLLQEQWDWQAMRDYVIQQIELRNGPQVRNPIKEKSIFGGFITRWGAEKAQKIARTAFEVHDGMWCNAPISTNRFCKASDAYFASKIAERLT